MSFLIPSYLLRVFASPSCPFAQIFICWYPLNILSLAVNPFLGSICSCSASSNHLYFLKSSPMLITLLDICTGLLMEINSLKLITIEFTVQEECLSNHWLGEESRNHTIEHAYFNTHRCCVSPAESFFILGFSYHKVQMWVFPHLIASS